MPEPDALVSGKQRLPLKDIERLERRGISRTRTTLSLIAMARVAVVAYAATQPVALTWHGGSKPAEAK
jgi:hypothetical protein